MNNNSIDLVLMYLDDGDSIWMEKYKKYKKEEIEKGISAPDDKQAFGAERIRCWDNMQYWFRGIEKNCPWIRKIFFIVQSKSQIPQWLNINHPKLRVVYHDEYIPSELLPTFNPRVIQAFIPYIKDLSECYIITDDDIFFMNPIKSTMFFRQQKPVHMEKFFWGTGTYEEKMGAWGHILDNTYEIEKQYGGIRRKYAPYHLPSAHSKTTDKKILQDNYNAIYNSLKISKFRHPKNILPTELYVHVTKRIKNFVRNDAMYCNCCYTEIKEDTNFEKYNNYDIVCFNDTDVERTGDFFMAKKKMQRYLNNRFSKPSTFEKKEEIIIPKRYDVTLIIPCHNLEKWITPCLNSILSQTNTRNLDRKAIFICDNCEDNTHQIIENKMKTATNWDYEIIDAQVGSPGYARNIGLEKANTQYIWFIDGDDWITCDDAIDELHRLMVKDDMDIIEFKIKSTANPEGKFGGGTVWRCMLSSRIIGDMKFNDRQMGEDNDFIWDVYHKPNAKYGKIAMAPYFYNYPREGSQSYINKKNK